MRTYIGIDLGTSGMKILLVAADGKILAENTQNYSVSYPNVGWSEQTPCDWIKAFYDGVNGVLADADKSSVCAISFGGQMHGSVILDENDNVIRPCILWNDGRTEKETRYLNEVIGKDELISMTANIAFAGFTAPKLLWLKENEPENFAKIKKIMLPKDYMVYMLTGVYCSEPSDASGTLFFDVKNREWSKAMCDICGLSVSDMPKIIESGESVGSLKAEIADMLGLDKSVKVVSGAGDNAAAAIGCGVIGNGGCNISLGTSGTVFISSDTFVEESSGAIHSFCHANGKYHLLACILSAASCRKWWLEDILSNGDYELDELQVAQANTEGIYFLPYLSGERSPHNDVNIRGAFLGLSASTTKAQMSRAVIEGVSFAIRDCIEAAKAQGIKIEQSALCGGGAKSKAWRQILADILGIRLDILTTEQGPAYGAAILAMVGCKEYSNAAEAVRSIVSVQSSVSPDAKQNAYYEKRYQTFKKLYPLLKDIKLN